MTNVRAESHASWRPPPHRHVLSCRGGSGQNPPRRGSHCPGAGKREWRRHIKVGLSAWLAPYAGRLAVSIEMSSFRKVALLFIAVILATSAATASASDSHAHGPLQGMRVHRRADAGRQMRAREVANDAQLREMYNEFVAKAQRERREAVSFEEFLKHPKVAKRAFWEPHGDDDGSSSSSASSSASSTASSGSGSGNGHSYTGQATYYTPGLGACGKSSSSSDLIVAVSHELFDKYSNGNPNDNELCGKKIKATYQGKSTTVTIVDRCTGCKETDLDFSPTAFKKLAATSKGRLNDMKWSFVE